MSDEEYACETIRRALEGDHEAGREALRLCRAALDHGNFPRPLAAYLAERLWLIDRALDEAEQLREHKKSSGSVRSDRDAGIAKALCINRPPGKPRDPLPDWEVAYAAYGTLLLKADMPPEQVKRAMSDARKKFEPDRTPRKTGVSREDMDGLDRSNAGTILKKYKSLSRLDEDLLRHMAGPLRQILPTNPPQPKAR